MFEIEIKRDGVVVANITYKPSVGGHNTTLSGNFGQITMRCGNLEEAVRQAQIKFAGL